MPKKKQKTPIAEDVVDLTQLKEDTSFKEKAALIEPGDKVLAAVGYFSLLCILPLILRPKSEFCQFHGKQALAIFISFIPLSIFARLIDLFAGIAIGMGFFSFLFFLLQGYACWRAWEGHSEKIPPFSLFVDKYLKWENDVKQGLSPSDSEEE